MFPTHDSEFNLTRLLVKTVEQKFSRYSLQSLWIEPESIQPGQYSHLRRVGIESTLLLDSDLGDLNDLVGIDKYVNLNLSKI